MAYGPCGEEFREAFSCFVFSKEEPKGMDCIDRFQHMQTCFRAYPDVYGEELEDDEDEPLDEKAGKAVVNDEPALVAAAPEADAPGVAAVAEKVNEELQSDSTRRGERAGKTGLPSTATQAPDASQTKVSEPSDGESAQSKLLKQSSSNKSRPEDNGGAALQHKSSADASTPPTSSSALDTTLSTASGPSDLESTPSKLLKEDYSTKTRAEDDAGAGLLPKAAHDATDAPSGK
jgi:hypothetical protein